MASNRWCPHTSLYSFKHPSSPINGVSSGVTIGGGSPRAIPSSTKDFAINHPAGSLGKKLTLSVNDLMIPSRNTKGLDNNSNIKNVITQITENGIGATWVYRNKLNKNELLGIITDGDIRRAFKNNPAENWGNLTAKDLMTEDPITIFSEELAIKALTKMELNRKKPISVMPVLKKEDNSFLGLIRLHDLVKAGIS